MRFDIRCECAKKVLSASERHGGKPLPQVGIGRRLVITALRASCCLPCGHTLGHAPPCKLTRPKSLPRRLALQVLVQVLLPSGLRAQRRDPEPPASAPMVIYKRLGHLPRQVGAASRCPLAPSCLLLLLCSF